jgi:HSP20 family molecular chaperone IbpA
MKYLEYVFNPFLEFSSPRSSESIYDSFSDFSSPRTTSLYKFVSKDGNHNLHICATGYEKDELKIEIDDGYLIITGEKKEPLATFIPKKINLKFLFSKDFVLDEANLKNGILTISFKTKEKKEIQNILIKTE